jgi:hypothetical protein
MEIAMSLDEPKDVYPEERFESAVREVVKLALKNHAQKAVILPRFGFDIAVLIDTESGPTVRWIEVKVFGGQRMGGVGIGNSRREQGLRWMRSLPEGTRLRFSTAPSAGRSQTQSVPINHAGTPSSILKRLAVQSWVISPAGEAEQLQNVGAAKTHAPLGRFLPGRGQLHQ